MSEVVRFVNEREGRVTAAGPYAGRLVRLQYKGNGSSTQVSIEMFMDSGWQELDIAFYFDEEAEIVLANARKRAVELLAKV